MKRIIIGLVSLAALCGLAYYSSYLYTDRYYENNGNILERKENLITSQNLGKESENGTDGEDGTDTDSGTSQMNTQTQSPGSSQAGQKDSYETAAENQEAENFQDEVQETSVPSDLVKPEFSLNGGDGMDFQYYLVEEFGYINIYLQDMETIYEYTDIPISDLPQKLQDEICTGKGLASEQELYDFLENYSS